MLHVAVITDDEVVRIESRPYVAPPMVDWQAVYDGDEPMPGEGRG